MRKVVRYELEVPTSADSIWNVYSSPDAPRLLRDVLLPGVFERLDILEGDGGVGTVVECVFTHGIVPHSYKEIFSVIDHEKRMKEVVMIEGGFLDMGCTSYLDRIQILEITSNSCLIKSCIVYEVKEEFADAMSKLITTVELESMAKVFSDYVLKKRFSLFGFEINPKLWLTMLLCLVISFAAVVGMLLIGGVPF